VKFFRFKQFEVIHYPEVSEKISVTDSYKDGEKENLKQILNKEFKN
tara:strand:+ start:818 stop:955 length:138 start_codon:yes stop_codon:yes gene_type:complete